MQETIWTAMGYVTCTVTEYVACAAVTVWTATGYVACAVTERKGRWHMLYGLGIYLGINSIIDFWKKRISLLLSLAFFAGGIFCRLRQTEEPAGLLLSLFLSLLPGLFLIGLAFATAQKLGIGDGIVMTVCGVFLGLRQTVFLLMLSLLLSGLAGMAAIMLKKASAKTQIPWVPFVFAAFLLTCVLQCV